METELEVKFINIDADKLRQQLKQLGAVLVQPEVLMKRKNFDFSNRSLEKVNGWVRVRDEGNKTTLSYKQLNERTLHGSQEVCLEVNNFDQACDFLAAIGLEQKAYQETKRESWRYGEVEVTIDTWPWLPTFVELEATSEPTLKKAASDLGFDWPKALHGSVEIVYQQYYDVSDKELDDCPTITFGPVPEWLLAKKK